ncbi:Cyclic nucleotide-binding domain-containing protein [Pseudarcicella hirudinis]|uniref:Cyclic nucleotide-binding domain-containing protein n=1 Tax=Pseudarcicella hirudinis TaxID=1079859 RepID=A0A1I5NVF2_9BACT|nr:cyclic nucleotide-binding domain-containing protein [Pseudarcicella hirudinis]SFP25788.1 Cyclic nucleotide-binding domain-containing protein [Pseudarcicella hirudinis]
MGKCWISDFLINMIDDMIDIESKILEKGTELFFNKGEFLFKQEQDADYVFFLKDGEVELQKDTGIVFNISRQRCFLGLEEMILENKHEQTAVVKDTSILLVFDRLLIAGLISQNEKARRYFIQKMCDQFHVFQREFE